MKPGYIIPAPVDIYFLNIEAMNISTRSFVLSSTFLLALISIGLTWNLPEGHAWHSGRPAITPDIPSEFPIYQPTQSLTGYLTIAVQDDTRALIAALAKEFHSWHPNLKLALLQSKNYEGSPTRSTLGSFLDGLAKPRLEAGKHRGFLGSSDIRLLVLSKKLTNEEKTEFISRFGYRPVEIPLARDAVVFYVNYQNPVQGLTLNELQALFSDSPVGEEMSGLRIWGDVGMNGGWKITPVNLYVPNKFRAISTYTFLQKFALANGKFRKDVIEKTGSASVVLAVSNDKNGIGGGDFGFHIPHVRVVPIAKKAKLPYVTPTTQTIMNGTYPLSHPVYLYINKTPSHDLPPAISEFLNFIHSRTAQEVVVKEGLFPLKPSEVQRNLQLLSFSPDGVKAKSKPSK